MEVSTDPRLKVKETNKEKYTRIMEGVLNYPNTRCRAKNINKCESEGIGDLRNDCDHTDQSYCDNVTGGAVDFK